MGAWYSENDPRRAEQDQREADQGGAFEDIVSRNKAVEKQAQTPKKRTAVKK